MKEAGCVHFMCVPICVSHVCLHVCVSMLGCDLELT